MENEIPLSNTGNISTLEDTTATTIVMDDDAVIDSEPNKLANVSGSYTNLFRADTIAANGKSSGAVISPTGADCSDKIHNTDNIINANELLIVSSISGHENLYSNIPSQGTAGSRVRVPKRSSGGQLSSMPHEDHSGIKSMHDPNLHLYSNIGSSICSTNNGNVITGQRQSSSSGNNFHQQPTHNSNGMNNNTNVTSEDPSMLNASFITSELDLDDPVVTSAFTNNCASIQSVVDPNSSVAMIASSSSHVPLPPHKSSQPITAIEMKNVIKTIDPSIIIQATTNNNTNSPSFAATAGPHTTASSHSISNSNTSSNIINNNPSSYTGSGAFITGSNRLRLLQESTMIDTALDLDSLDGSIGNNSQSCLVKTAIV